MCAYLRRGFNPFSKGESSQVFFASACMGQAKGLCSFVQSCTLPGGHARWQDNLLSQVFEITGKGLQAEAFSWLEYLGHYDIGGSAKGSLQAFCLLPVDLQVLACNSFSGLVALSPTLSWERSAFDELLPCL